MDRREMLKTLSIAATGMAAGALPTSEAASAKDYEITDMNPYGAPPGSGISIPPYYRPTNSVKNRNNYFPQSEELGKDEMRITFMGSQPFPPRLNQAGTSIMVELGSDKRFFFDFGSGCMRNIIANQVPVPEINDIFITHLHVDHYADLPYLWAFAPFNGRYKPLRVIGPSGRAPELGTSAMCDNMRKMGAWHEQAFSGCAPVQDGYDIEVTEFDFKDDGGICYDKDGVKVTHWRRSHAMDGASAYRLDWNGLSFVWTGDGKPDKLTAKYAKGVDVFVTEMAVDIVNLWAIKQGVPPLVGALTLDIHHTPHYGVGYLANLVQPKLAMATHLSFDRELIGEMVAGVRTHYKGLFAFGTDGTVVNVTKDRLWVREAALPESSDTARPNAEWMIREMYDGKIPTAFPKMKYTVAGNQEQAVREVEIPPEVFTPKDQIRRWVREWPQDASPAMLFGGIPAKE
ncbi:MAG TPA: guanitoxin biosynthesis MBL fold metallo-hydrolase GntH [Desulfomonilaceae bacterium]|nr:guanitoxin biosynthesis MBL fold metallo-hydrolase GntH [Desulfomonilaceae bacterium]